MKASCGATFDYALAAEMMCISHPDHTEAVNAIIEKRKPNFSGGRRTL